MDLSIPVSGMQAASTAFDAAAGGIARSSLSGSNSSTQNAPTAPADSSDLSTSAVALLQAKLGFEANVRVAKVEDEMDKSTFSVLG